MPGKGDCFSVAAHLVEDNPDYVLCHGEPIGTGKANKGKRFGHAWVEYADNEITLSGRTIRFTTVIDKANGHNIELPAELYYAFGRIDPDTVRRYTREEAAAEMLRHGHYGPWP